VEVEVAEIDNTTNVAEESNDATSSAVSERSNTAMVVVTDSEKEEASSGAKGSSGSSAEVEVEVAEIDNTTNVAEESNDATSSAVKGSSGSSVEAVDWAALSDCQQTDAVTAAMKQNLEQRKFQRLEEEAEKESQTVSAPFNCSTDIAERNRSFQRDVDDRQHRLASHAGVRPMGLDFPTGLFDLRPIPRETPPFLLEPRWTLMFSHPGQSDLQTEHLVFHHIGDEYHLTCDTDFANPKFEVEYVPFGSKPVVNYNKSLRKHSVLFVREFESSVVLLLRDAMGAKPVCASVEYENRATVELPALPYIKRNKLQNYNKETFDKTVRLLLSKYWVAPLVLEPGCTVMYTTTPINQVLGMAMNGSFEMKLFAYEEAPPVDCDVGVKRKNREETSVGEREAKKTPFDIVTELKISEPLLKRYNETSVSATLSRVETYQNQLDTAQFGEVDIIHSHLYTGSCAAFTSKRMRKLAMKLHPVFKWLKECHFGFFVLFRHLSVKCGSLFASLMGTLKVMHSRDESAHSMRSEAMEFLCSAEAFDSHVIVSYEEDNKEPSPDVQMTLGAVFMMILKSQEKDVWKDADIDHLTKNERDVAVRMFKAVMTDFHYSGHAGFFYCWDEKYSHCANMKPKLVKYLDIIIIGGFLHTKKFKHHIVEVFDSSPGSRRGVEVISNGCYKRDFRQGVITTVRVGEGEYVGILHFGKEGKMMEVCENGFGTDEDEEDEMMLIKG
jgi:hypothetical protein